MLCLPLLILLGAMPIAVSSAGDGSVTLLDSSSLEPVRSFSGGGPSSSPMPLLADPVRGLIYVGNYHGGLARLPAGKSGDPTDLDLSGPTAGMALSPDGKRLAVMGLSDGKLRLVDPEAWKVLATVALGEVGGKQALPGQPLWLKDKVLVPDNAHGDLLLLSKDGKVGTRRHLRSSVRALLPTPDGSILALAEGDAEAKVAPAVVVLSPALAVIREIEVALPAGEPPRLHGMALSPDGATVVVANVGSLRVAGPTTVAAYDWKTGEKRWAVETSRNAGHVAFLDPSRVVVVGHRAASLEILDAGTGAPKESWEILGAGSLGHSLEVGPDGSVTILDAAIGRVIRYKEGVRTGESPRIGEGGAESTLKQ